MIRRCLFLNGPPGCGKDTVSRLISASIPLVFEYKMARPLKIAARELLGISAFLWGQIMTETGWKDMRLPDTSLTPREVLISLAEDWAKPKLGRDIFGKLAVTYFEREQIAAHLVVISDAGFDYELVPLVEHFGAVNCAVLTIEREGCSFDNDSRRPINGPDLGIAHAVLLNKYDLDLLSEQCLRAIASLWPGLEFPR